MTHYTGVVCPVPKANRQAFIEHARRVWPLFQKWGARRQVETWADDVPAGKFTDFHRAVALAEDEAVVFSWIEWPDKATADAAWDGMRSDPATADMGDMPFDGGRMIWGGFDPVLDEGGPDGAGHYQGFVLAVPLASKAAYVDMARMGWDMFRAEGALCQVEAWGVDVPHGKRTDFHRAVEAREDETIVFAWVGWPDKATADAAGQKMMNDPAMAEMNMPFDGKRMIWAGFTPILDLPAMS